MTVEGIDLSAANPVPMWDQVPAEIEFVYLRATVKLARDARLTAHWNGAVAHARMCGAYSFAYVDDDPVDEVKAFIDSDAINMILPPVLDLETMNGRDPAWVLKWARDWLVAVEKACGRTPMIYTGPGFWTSLGPLAKTIDWARYPLWIAHYGVKKPIVPAPWTAWTFWQYAGNTIKNAAGQVIAAPGIVPGVSGEVDRNRYAGTSVDLRKLAGLPV